MSKNYSYNLIMIGSDSEVVKAIPAAYRFVSVINSTDNTIQILRRQVTNPLAADQIGLVLPYTSQTFPIDNVQDVTMKYTDGGTAGTKVASVIFSEENLGYSGSLGTTVTGNVGIITDSVGLAKAAQLPSTLTGTGFLKVSIQEDDAKTGVKLTAGAAGDQTVKASPGKLYGVVSATASVTLIVKDGTTEKWLVLPQSQSVFSAPLECTTSIVINFSAAGDAYVLYE